jgi:hypothetical protein
VPLNKFFSDRIFGSCSINEIATSTENAIALERVLKFKKTLIFRARKLGFDPVLKHALVMMNHRAITFSAKDIRMIAFCLI